MKKIQHIAQYLALAVLVLIYVPVMGHGSGQQPESKADGRQGQGQAHDLAEGVSQLPQKRLERVPLHGKSSQLSSPSAQSAESNPVQYHTGKLAHSSQKANLRQAKKTVKGIQKRENSDMLYFSMGFFLGFVGLLVAYLVSNRDKRAVRWSAIGAGISIVLGLIAIIALVGITAAPLSAL